MVDKECLISLSGKLQVLVLLLLFFNPVLFPFNIARSERVREVKRKRGDSKRDVYLRVCVCVCVCKHVCAWVWVTACEVYLCVRKSVCESVCSYVHMHICLFLFVLLVVVCVCCF